ncbi:MAG: FAD-binding oxidoreductase, partial [bacterium]
MQFKSPDIALHSSPGRFLQLRITENLDPFLRRPFSISRVDKKRGIIDILYKVVGRGTELMTHFKKNDLIDFVGPLGNSFNIDGDFQDAIIVAGGIGCAPIFYLIDELIKKEKNITLIFGAQNIKHLVDFNQYENRIDLSICT